MPRQRKPASADRCRQVHADGPAHLEVGGEGVGQAHVAGEGRQDEVAHLDARGRHHVAQLKVVLAQELWEIVQQHEQHAQRPL